MIDTFVNHSLYSGLLQNCSRYIIESCGNPVLKNLSTRYDIIDTVKIRQRKGMDGQLSIAYSNAFEFKSLYNRALFTNGTKSIATPDVIDIETYYVFPPNDYRYLYNPEVMNSSVEYKTVFDLLFNEQHTESSFELVIDLLKFQYKSTDLAGGIQAGTEIIFYNIPSFYVIKCSACPNYNELYDKLLESLHL